MTWCARTAGRTAATSCCTPAPPPGAGADARAGGRGGAPRGDVVLPPGAVVTLPVRAAGPVVLLRSHRHAVGETLWEVPAGTLEPPEPPEECAVRELIEET